VPASSTTKPLAGRSAASSNPCAGGLAIFARDSQRRCFLGRPVHAHYQNHTQDLYHVGRAWGFNQSKFPVAFATAMAALVNRPGFSMSHAGVLPLSTGSSSHGVVPARSALDAQQLILAALLGIGPSPGLDTCCMCPLAHHPSLMDAIRRTGAPSVPCSQWQRSLLPVGGHSPLPHEFHTHSGPDCPPLAPRSSQALDSGALLALIPHGNWAAYSDSHPSRWIESVTARPLDDRQSPSPLANRACSLH